jgi:hypothetical protein
MNENAIWIHDPQGEPCLFSEREIISCPGTMPVLNRPGNGSLLFAAASAWRFRTGVLANRSQVRASEAVFPDIGIETYERVPDIGLFPGTID